MNIGGNKNPASPEAITLAEVGPGVSFTVLNPDGKEIKSGTFLESPGYDETEGCYVPVNAEIEPDGEESAIGVYDSGIVCHPNGEWSGSFTVKKALDQ